MGDQRGHVVRNVHAVEGADRVRWLDGMLSADVGALGPERPGCYALLLTAKGRIVADLNLLQRGDLLCVFSAGAYGMVMASNYNSIPRPAEVLVDGSEVQLIRRRETLEDLLALER